MNTTFRQSAAIVWFAVLPLLGQVQRQQEIAPLRNWATPLYWQPAAEETAAGGFKPLITANATNLPVGSNALVFVGMTPCRIVDTRAGAGFTGAFGPPNLMGGASRTFPVQASTSCSIPAIAQAYSFNVTVVPSGPLGFLTMYPTGQPRPVASTLNAPQGQVVANAAIEPAGSSGAVDAFASNNTDLVIDINGYYAAASDPNLNTGLGPLALASDTSGKYNTAVGGGALAFNTTGSENTAEGVDALNFNQTGNYNTAVGYQALASNAATGNTAIGAQALNANTVGAYNYAGGDGSLFLNTTGSYNVAAGTGALVSNRTGSSNVGIGFNTLANNDTGSSNVAIGGSAGASLTTGDNNIIIGSNYGAAGMANTIIIGDGVNQSRAFIYGIRSVTTGNANAVPVLIDNNGQLGTASSSRRFKEDISSMDDASSGLLRLRPVTYRYKKPYADGSKPLDYGLIAEEVAEVYPDLVATGADGQIETVQYQKLTPMLLNELQKQHARVQAQEEKITLLENRLTALESLLAAKPASAPLVQQ